MQNDESAEVMNKNVDLWMWFALMIIINKMQNYECRGYD